MTNGCQGTEGAGEQNSGKTGDHMWSRDLSNEGRASEEIASNRDKIYKSN